MLHLNSNNSPIMTTGIFLLLAVVAVHLPSSAFSLETENGYLCNLCHSLQNDYPYPPPAAEDKIVRFTQSQDEQFGLPWDRGSACLEVWDTVLDFANPNVIDESSCRSMAAAYAPQCCNDIIINEQEQEQDQDEPESDPRQQQQEEHDTPTGTADVETLLKTENQQQEEVISARNTNSEKTTTTQRMLSRENHSSMATGRDINDNDNDNDNNNLRRKIDTPHLRGRR